MSPDSKKRKPVLKGVRFEVFKRDKFRCQYCGAAAPEVLLQIDHIKPLAQGGTNDITNLVTACAPCNSGKGAKSLDDDSAVSKARKQMEELQERREQLEMMMAWRQGLRDLKGETTDRVCDYWHDLAPGWVLNDTGRRKVSKWIRRFSVEQICSAMDVAAEQYLKSDGEGNTTSESWNEAFSKVPGICRVEQASKEDPDVKELYYIRGIVRNRLEGRYYDNAECLNWLKAARSWEVPMEDLRTTAKKIRSWTQFDRAICELIDEQKRVLGGDA